MQDDRPAVPVSGAQPPPEPQSTEGGGSLHQAAQLQSELAEFALRADLEGLQKRLIQGACSLLHSEAVILILVDEHNPGWFVFKTLDSQAKWALHLQPDEGRGSVSDCIRSGRTIRLEGREAQINFDPTCTGASLFQARSLVIAPLQADGRTLGALLAINHHQDCFSAQDQEMIEDLAHLAASSVQTARLIQGYKITGADLEANRWELFASRNFLRALFDHLPANLYIIDREYRLLAVNKSRALRSTPPESSESLAGKLCYQALFGRSEPCLECKVVETLANARITHRDERRRNGGDEIYDWEISSYPILDDQGEVVQAILFEQDVTEKKRLEAILTQSEKLAAVGQLAAGVAHEINNPLTAIIANAQILHRELPPESDLQESVDLIARAGARAAQVVRNLLDFARKEEYRLRLTDLNDTIERAIELVQHELIARGILLELRLDPDLPSILASADHLQSVWLNLLLNAIDSLDKTPARILVSSRKLEGELQITVADNGKGIPADHLSRIFEPFYTTKAPGRGTGLGLSVSHRIVRQHGGRFQVESQPDRGSVFTVILPAS